MRLGGPLFGSYTGPEEWLALLRKYGYSAAYCPVDSSADEETIKSYEEAGKKAGIVIAEVGAWSNPLSPMEEVRRSALEFCKAQLDLADRIGALCCVNIAGSRGKKWDGPCEEDLTEETFEAIVETVREIIDAVKPIRTFYTLETMPWMYPDSPDSYLRLIKAIDRKQFAVHLDIANMINTPWRYFFNREFIKDCIEKLGPYIKSCHAKDVLMSETFNVHIDQVRPGIGKLDYTTLIRELEKVSPNIPLMMEHLETEEEYLLAGEYIRTKAKEAGVSLR